MKNRNIILGAILSALAWFGPLPGAQGVVPPPDGGYPGFTTAEGTNALKNLTTGSGNTAVGWYSLFSDTYASFNTATGVGALLLATESRNTATGAGALLSNTTGGQNTATGAFALLNIGSGSDNTAIGNSVGQNLVFSSGNTYVGNYVGYLTGEESDTIRIGDLSNASDSLACYIGGIWNNPQPVGGQVVVVTIDLADDHLGWALGTTQAGSASAQRGAPVPRSAPGAPSQRPAMLNGKVDKVEKLEAMIAQQQKQIESLAAGLQKVSAQLEASKPAPQVVSNP